MVQFKVCSTLEHFNSLKTAGNIDKDWVVLIQDQPALWAQDKIVYGPYSKGYLDQLFNGKVSVAEGMGLSSNDFTTAYKNKLDGLSNYTLPTASATTLGGIKVGTNLSIADGVLSAVDTTYSAATTSAAGLMSAADKVKLNGIAASANNYTLPVATTSTLGGVKQGTNVTIASDGTISATDTTYSNATITAAGLMSSTDKSKLDGIAANANNYTLPTASASVLGGIKVGTNLSIDSNGVLSSTDTKYTLPTASASTLGGVKVGTNLSIDANGVLSSTNTTYSTATTSTAGLMSATDKQNLDTVYGLVSADADGTINKFNEIVSFLGGIKDTNTLEGILSGISEDIASKMNATALDWATI